MAHKKIKTLINESSDRDNSKNVVRIDDKTVILVYEGITDEEIEIWARANSLSSITEQAMIKGAKAMRDGEIKSKLMEE